MNHETDAFDWADPATGVAALHAFERLAEIWHLTLHEKLTLLWSLINANLEQKSC